VRRLPIILAAAGLLLATSVGLGAGVEGDIRFQRKGDVAAEMPPALFPHWVHRIRFRCYVCHESIFTMKAGANDVSMDVIGQGKFCGACHDGKTAFAVAFETCGRCHRE
jgi:c(7)-type cytochrome triheme protein